VRILYVATDQRVPGFDGGAAHVSHVATGLANLGHDVHVVAAPGHGKFPSGAVHWYGVGAPLGSSRLRLFCAPAVKRLARAIKPDVVVERYYNFGGEGVLAAQATGAALALEVNAPVVDYPRSPKRILDRMLVVEPLRRWREWQCQVSDLIVTPTAEVLPQWISPGRVLEIEWGADTTNFSPSIVGTAPYVRRNDDLVVVFVGAFRAWHGAVHLVRAVRKLRERGYDDVAAVFIGDGPERRRTQQEAEGLERVTFFGRVPHDQIPSYLVAADIGIAPFDILAHPPLSLTFYWSPLKIFEYMAAGLPVVTPDIPRLRRIYRDGEEGVSYDPNDTDGLADAIVQLRDQGVRRRLGAAGRDRVTRLFSWTKHCEQLAEAFSHITERRRQ
jgi:glycosyltransferase involved in cell wall biosynthesis